MEVPIDALQCGESGERFRQRGIDENIPTDVCELRETHHVQWDGVDGLHPQVALDHAHPAERKVIADVAGADDQVAGKRIARSVVGGKGICICLRADRYVA